MPTPEPIPQISPAAFAAQLASADIRPQLIDVRELQEVAIAAMDGFEVLPKGESLKGDCKAPAIHPWGCSNPLSSPLER